MQSGLAGVVSGDWQAVYWSDNGAIAFHALAGIKEKNILFISCYYTL
ncbi:hypothetical protein [Pantoea stewartii]|uniref:Uncharacterized protein n=1 Tax=Pantoea stewartii subsp. stewartii DC283 TaxID=660596 RepID=H3RM29_PANSE|nr:hypothetical protein [Pantoea stewartii]EHT97537.1 hypothetical protein CKS_5628 [Pantoea stewartii subsp. stewartii DC283]